MVLDYYLGDSFQHDMFQEMIKIVLENRQEYVTEKKSLTIDIDPRIADIFERSKMIAGKHHCSIACTVNTGKSHKLLLKNILKKRERT